MLPTDPLFYTSFVKKANNFLSTIKFTAEMSETEITFLDTKVYEGVRFDKEAILDVQTHFKPTETLIPVHERLLVSPTRREKRLHQRGSAQASKD